MKAVPRYPLSRKMQDIFGYLSYEGAWQESGFGQQEDEDVYSEDEDVSSEDVYSDDSGEQVVLSRYRTSAILHEASLRDMSLRYVGLRWI